MGRRSGKKGRPVSGWLVLDKPAGMGSTQAVAKVKRLFGAAKAGHAGTLDPLASGMLPIALGEATKTVSYVMQGEKTYRFAVAWGEERTTDDLEGEVTDSSDTRPTEAEINKELGGFVGTIEQVPPDFSAIKIDGARAYDLARDGEKPDIPSRLVEVFSLELVALPDVDHAEFEVVCGKGTYVRSLARDLGRRLGCCGHVSFLRRIDVLPFTEDDLVTMVELEAAVPQPAEEPERPGRENRFESIDALLIDTASALKDLAHVAVSDDAAARIRLGNPVILRGRDAPVREEEACAMARGVLVAIGEIDHGMFKPKRVFRADS